VSDPTKAILQDVGKELKNNPPKVVNSTQKKFGVARAKKQKTAILLSKARKLGAHVPKVSGGY
jgi:hypothetical protein